MRTYTTLPPPPTHTQLVQGKKLRAAIIKYAPLLDSSSASARNVPSQPSPPVGVPNAPPGLDGLLQQLQFLKQGLEKAEGLQGNPKSSYAAGLQKSLDKDGDELYTIHFDYENTTTGESGSATVQTNDPDAVDRQRPTGE